MNSTQLYEAIINGDIDLTYFLAVLQDRVQAAYVAGYEDACTDADDVKARFLSECG